jgi:hypothetical protein
MLEDFAENTLHIIIKATFKWLLLFFRLEIN